MSGEVQEKVADIVRKTLVERFAGIAFGPSGSFLPSTSSATATARSTRIVIVFDGDQEALDARWTSTLIRRIRPKLFDAGVEEFPSFSFASMAEAAEWVKRCPKPHARPQRDRDSPRVRGARFR